MNNGAVRTNTLREFYLDLTHISLGNNDFENLVLLIFVVAIPAFSQARRNQIWIHDQNHTNQKKKSKTNRENKNHRHW